MATRLENLIAARDGFTAQLADIAAGPKKPSYNIDGQSVSWTQYYQFLMKSIDDLDAKINAADPYEFVSEGG